MEDRAFADRLITYADALAAVAFVGTSGLALALAEPEVRCSLVGSFPAVLIGNVVWASFVSALLVVLRRWETDLRADAPLPPKSARYSRRLHLARLAVVWLSTGAAILTLHAATRDRTCL